MQAYSNPDREHDEHALPDLEIFQMAAHEIAAQDEDMVYEYMKRREFRLASMNSRNREAMLDAMDCFPGCMPDSGAVGPYATWREAKEAAQEDAAQ